MIRVNLLPEEYIEKKITIPIPLCQIAWVIMVVLIGVWQVNSAKAVLLKRDYNKVKAAHDILLPALEKANHAIEHFTTVTKPKLEFVNSSKDVASEWDRIMNAVSDATPPGIWFFSVVLSDEPPTFMRLEGFSQTYKDKPAMAAIGDYVLTMKQMLEGFLNQGKEKKTTFLKVETSTQPRNMGGLQVTQFWVEYRKEKLA